MYLASLIGAHDGVAIGNTSFFAVQFHSHQTDAKHTRYVPDAALRSFTCTTGGRLGTQFFCIDGKKSRDRYDGHIQHFSFALQCFAF